MQPNVGSGRVFLCPSGDQGSRSHYAFNAKLAEVQLKKITDPATTVMFFETDGGWNVSGSPELMLKSSRHRRVFVVGFADGHVEQMAEAGLKNLRWDP
jgi:prepilin-type processing-associated H-X9-DG protein